MVRAGQWSRRYIVRGVVRAGQRYVVPLDQ